MTDKTFGLELLFNNLKDDIKKKEDVLMVLIHYALIKSGFKCIGVNDQPNTDEKEIKSELLPKEWNINPEYVFRYKLENSEFVLRSCHSDNNTIIFNFMQTEKLKVSNTMFNYEESISTTDLTNVLPAHKDILELVQRDLISSFISTEKKSVDTQTKNVEQPSRLRYPTVDYDDYYHEYRRVSDLRNIGSSDLYPGFDPSIGSGGGMLFDPFSNRARINPNNALGGPRRLPRGAIPPGARFDPFGPPDCNRHPRPDRSPPDFFA